MTVYLEYALAENILLDGLFLYLALRCARAKVALWRLCLAALLGGVEAIFFPLLDLPAFWALVLKISGGALLALICVAERGVKVHLIVIAGFFSMTFLFGGLLIAVYAGFGISYLPGQGYLLEQAPVALVLGLSAAFAIACVRLFEIFYRYRMRRRNLFSCTLCAGEAKKTLRGYADSGNNLRFRGKPVCVISAVGALALFRGRQPVGRMTIGTVAGSRESPVFVCDSLTVGDAEHRGVFFTVGEVPSREHSIILHTALLEDRHETFELVEGVAEEAGSK